jgi:hypothetical protein
MTTPPVAGFDREIFRVVGPEEQPVAVAGAEVGDRGVAERAREDEPVSAGTAGQGIVATPGVGGHAVGVAEGRAGERGRVAVEEVVTRAAVDPAIAATPPRSSTPRSPPVPSPVPPAA